MFLFCAKKRAYVKRLAGDSEKSEKDKTAMLTQISSSGYAGDYGGVDRTGALLSNPGAADFPEDDLHEPHLSTAQQVAQSFHYGRQIKCLVVLFVPFLIVLIAGPREEQAAAAATSSSAAAAQSGGIFKSFRLLPEGGAAGGSLFWMSLLLILPMNILLVEYLEDLVVRYESPSLGIAVNLAFEHAAELLFSVIALVYSKRTLCWVKPMLLGSILLNMLGVLGASILAAPLTDGTSVDLGISAWTAFSASGLVFSTAVFLLPTVYGVTVVGPDAADQILRQHASQKQLEEQQTRNMLFISRSLALAVLVVYALYLWKVMRSNTNYYVASDNPNSPSSLTYALQYRERMHNTQQVDLGSRYSLRFALTGAAICFVLLVCLCVVLVATLHTATKTVVSLPLPFTLVVLLPLIFEANGSAAAVVMARVGRPDIAASIAFASIVHLYMFVLPSVVVVAWLVLRVPLELTFHPFLVCCCFISALVAAQVMTASRVRWLEGGTLVALYGLTVCICLLGRWHLCSNSF